MRAGVVAAPAAGSGGEGRELEARPVDERFVDFSSTPPAHSGEQPQTFDPAKMAAKL